MPSAIEHLAPAVLDEHVDCGLDGAAREGHDVAGAAVLGDEHTRFSFGWEWRGEAATLLSRATDETGYVQPTQSQLIAVRGPGPIPYHANPIIGWHVNAAGAGTYFAERWQ